MIIEKVVKTYDATLVSIFKNEPIIVANIIYISLVNKICMERIGHFVLRKKVQKSNIELLTIWFVYSHAECYLKYMFKLI